MEGYWVWATGTKRKFDSGGDAIHAQATVSNRSAADRAVFEQPRNRQTPQILCLVAWKSRVTSIFKDHKDGNHFLAVKSTAESQQARTPNERHKLALQVKCSWKRNKHKIMSTQRIPTSCIVLHACCSQNRQLAKLFSGNKVRGKVAIVAVQMTVNFNRSLLRWSRKVSWAQFPPDSEKLRHSRTSCRAFFLSVQGTFFRGRRPIFLTRNEVAWPANGTPSIGWPVFKWLL